MVLAKKTCNDDDAAWWADSGAEQDEMGEQETQWITHHCL